MLYKVRDHWVFAKQLSDDKIVKTPRRSAGCPPSPAPATRSPSPNRASPWQERYSSVARYPWPAVRPKKAQFNS